MHILFFLALFLTACITDPKPKVHIIDGGTLDGSDTLIFRDGKRVPK
jgi:hypothetical protein